MQTDFASWPEDSRQLSPQEVVQLARLHIACLPQTAIGTLGWRYAACFYDYVDSSAAEHLRVHRNGDKVVAAAVLSIDAGKLLRRLWHCTPLIRHLLSGLPTPGRWRAMKTLWPAQNSTERNNNHFPELVFLFTAESFRRRGVARGLLERQETLLRSLGHDGYDVRTKNAAGNEAPRFYASQGFSLRATHRGIQYWRKAIA